ncbi:hypothetical protein [Clostridium sp.]|uniref:hypothetical protein n=1 Tax=Clostridium sp. TaxID=1506 RepID=UPI002FCC563C
MAEQTKIDKIEEKIQQLKAQKQAILNREKEKERRTRTRRLIQIGAIADNMGLDTVELMDKFKEHFLSNEKSKVWLDDFIEKNK